MPRLDLVSRAAAVLLAVDLFLPWFRADALVLFGPLEREPSGWSGLGTPIAVLLGAVIVLALVPFARAWAALAAGILGAAAFALVTLRVAVDQPDLALRAPGLSLDVVPTAAAYAGMVLTALVAWSAGQAAAAARA